MKIHNRIISIDLDDGLHFGMIIKEKGEKRMFLFYSIRAFICASGLISQTSVMIR